MDKELQTISANEVGTLQMSTPGAMVPQQNTDFNIGELEFYDPADSGLGALSKDDLVIPRLTIVQAQSEGGAEGAGKLSVNVTGDLYDKLTLAIIKLEKSRILFPDDFDRENQPLCRSHNFITPANDIPDATPMCDTCELLPLEPGQKKAKHKCEYANWTKNDKGKEIPPRCQEVWNLLVAQIDEQMIMPMWFSAKSKALGPTRKECSAIKMLSDARRLPSCSFQFDLTTKSVTDNKGTYCIPVYTHRVPVNADDLQVILEMRKSFKDVSVKDSQEPLEDERHDSGAGAAAADEKF